MNLKELKNKTILMFGKSRAFSESEFATLLKFHQINVVYDYSDEVVLAIDGKNMTPYEINESTKLYEQKKVKSVDINVLDRAVESYIDEETLLMSLKLNYDKLKKYLFDKTISDELFLRILSIYPWNGEGFFENSDNSDVSAAFIGRFYKHIERNRNAQHSNKGFLHLILHATGGELIETIANLEPLKKSFQTDSEDPNYKILTAIATHYQTSKKILNMLIKDSNTYMRVLIAMREDCDEFMQKTLFEFDNEKILKALSYNKNLDIHLALRLIENKEYEKNIARYINLNNRVFGLLYKSLSHDLATNSSMSKKMQQKLIDTGNRGIILALASNKNLHKGILKELVARKDEEINLAISGECSKFCVSLI